MKARARISLSLVFPLGCQANKNNPSIHLLLVLHSSFGGPYPARSFLDLHPQQRKEPGQERRICIRKYRRSSSRHHLPRFSQSSCVLFLCCAGDERRWRICILFSPRSRMITARPCCAGRGLKRLTILTLFRY